MDRKIYEYRGFMLDVCRHFMPVNEIKTLKARVEPWRELIAEIDDVEEMCNLGIEENDQSVEADVKEMYDAA